MPKTILLILGCVTCSCNQVSVLKTQSCSTSKGLSMTAPLTSGPDLQAKSSGGFLEFTTLSDRLDENSKLSTTACSAFLERFDEETGTLQVYTAEHCINPDRLVALRYVFSNEGAVQAFPVKFELAVNAQRVRKDSLSLSEPVRQALLDAFALKPGSNGGGSDSYTCGMVMGINQAILIAMDRNGLSLLDLVKPEIQLRLSESTHDHTLTQEMFAEAAALLKNDQLQKACMTFTDIVKIELKIPSELSASTESALMKSGELAKQFRADSEARILAAGMQSEIAEWRRAIETFSFMKLNLKPLGASLSRSLGDAGTFGDLLNLCGRLGDSATLPAICSEIRVAVDLLRIHLPSQNGLVEAHLPAFSDACYYSSFQYEQNNVLFDSYPHHKSFCESVSRYSSDLENADSEVERLAAMGSLGTTTYLAHFMLMKQWSLDAFRNSLLMHDQSVPLYIHGNLFNLTGGVVDLQVAAPFVLGDVTHSLHSRQVGSSWIDVGGGVQFSRRVSDPGPIVSHSDSGLILTYYGLPVATLSMVNGERTSGGLAVRPVGMGGDSSSELPELEHQPLKAEGQNPDPQKIDVSAGPEKSAPGPRSGKQAASPCVDG